MDCLEFRRIVGAEPGATGAALLEHRQACPACARHQDELQAMDALMLRALRVDLPPRLQPVRRTLPRGGWLALAASLLVAVGVGLTLWTVAPQPTLAEEVIGHVVHEPMALRATRQLDAEAIAAVLGPEGARLQSGLGEVVFATRCLVHGEIVPHLVVRTAGGTVTILLLVHREIAGPVRLADQGFAGVVLPTPRGSIAVVGQGPMDLDAIARQVSGAVQWAS